MVKSPVEYRQDPTAEKGGTPQPHQMKYRWVMLALVSLLYSVFGLVQRSMAPLVTPILEDLNMSFSQMGSILGSWQLTYIGVAAIAGVIIDRWGIRKSLLVGTLIMGLSASLRYFAGGFPALFFMVALFGVGGPMISIGCPKTIADWFTGKDRATAVGTYMTASAIGGLIALSATNGIVMPFTGYSWRLTFVVYGVVAFLAMLIWAALARDVKTAGTRQSASIIGVLKGLAGIRNVQLILIMGFFSFTINHGFTNWLPKILETGGLPPALAGLGASIPLLVGIPVVLVVPRIVPSHLRGRVVALTSLGLAAVMFTIIKTSGVTLVIELALWGLFSVCTMPLLMLILMDMPEVGSKYMGSAAGMFFCVAEIGGFAGPFLMGTLVDWTGTFLAGAFLLAAVAAAMFVMALLLKTRRDQTTVKVT